jgi:hypothetical protein
MELVAITDNFCDTYLNQDYKSLCRDMAAVCCIKGAPVGTGKAVSWAAGIIYSVGTVNFLSDPTQTPHMKTAELAKSLGVSPATMAAKAKVIREGLDLVPLDPRWCLPSLLADNPMVWMVQTQEGFIIDIRDAPREVQEQAYKCGLIPFIPAEKIVAPKRE